MVSHWGVKIVGSHWGVKIVVSHWGVKTVASPSSHTYTHTYTHSHPLPPSPPPRCQLKIYPCGSPTRTHTPWKSRTQRRRRNTTELNPSSHTVSNPPYVVIVVRLFASILGASLIILTYAVTWLITTKLLDRFNSPLANSCLGLPNRPLSLEIHF